jgi:UDP-N-acetylglucosamine/UDP-N-acetylgalactosamine diphosphorylase
VLAWGQDHLLRFWDDLEPIAQQHLASQIRAIDFNLLDQERRRIDSTAAAANSLSQRVNSAKSPPAIRHGDDTGRFTTGDARATGEAALRAGKVGMVLVAGGQGTRLGFDHPKGMFPIGPLSRRTLFEVLIDRLKAVAKKYDTRIPLFVMTSPATTGETRKFFARHRHFGLPPDDLRFFEQGTMPAVDAKSWKVLLAGKDEIARAPDGHGGMLAALARHVGIDALHQRGIELLFYGQIDNPLLAVCDPVFLGYHLLAQSEATTQVVRKTDPAERVGVVAEIDGRLEIVEYSDLSADQTARKQSDGTLLFWAGNTAVHVFDVGFLERVGHPHPSPLPRGEGEGMPLHHAKKKVAYIDDRGLPVEPTAPNAIKFERFIFDLLPQAKNALVVEVDRATSFSPVKNASGEASDTPETAQAAMIALHRSWLASAGVVIPSTAKVEIHPAFALEAEDVKQRIPPGTEIQTEMYFV